MIPKNYRHRHRRRRCHSSEYQDSDYWTKVLSACTPETNYNLDPATANIIHQIEAERDYQHSCGKY